MRISKSRTNPIQVGAGLQIPPNASRLLQKWGVERHFKSKVVEPGSISFRRWKSGEVIGHTRLVPQFLETYGAPYYVVHRADYLEALHTRVIELGVEVRAGCKVVDYDLDAPSVTLEDGSKHFADLVVAAEGITALHCRIERAKRETGVRSIAREQILGGKDVPPRLAGFAAYRATVPASKMMADPDTAWLVKKPTLNCW